VYCVRTHDIAILKMVIAVSGVFGRFVRCAIDEPVRMERFVFRNGKSQRPWQNGIRIILHRGRSEVIGMLRHGRQRGNSISSSFDFDRRRCTLGTDAQCKYLFFVYICNFFFSCFLIENHTYYLRRTYIRTHM